MLRTFILSTFLICLLNNSDASEKMILIDTTAGAITIALDFEKAPITCNNFMQYVNSGFFDNTIFHRVIPGFVIQGGGFEYPMTRKDTLSPIKNEADNLLKNTRGTLSMARTSDPGSATSQFFINTVDNAFLDHTGKNPSGWGYAVFAKVVEGLDIVDDIAATQTGAFNGMQDVPVSPITIKTMSLLEASTQ